MVPDFVIRGTSLFGEFVRFCTVISLEENLFRFRERVKVLKLRHKGQDIRGKYLCPIQGNIGPRSGINLLNNVTLIDFHVFCSRFCF